MKFKKMLSAILAGIMLVGGTVSVSAAGTVYTAEDFCKPVYSIPGYYGYYYNYLNGWGCDGLKPSFVWNPVLGKYEACTCKTCAGITAPTLPGSYYWVNGVYYKADEYHKNFVEKETVTVTPVQPTYSTNPGFVKNNKTTVRPLVRQNHTIGSGTTSGVIVENATIGSNGCINVTNPNLLGSLCQQITIPGGKFYPSNKVDINEFFEKNTYSVAVYEGNIQSFGTGFKMVSSNPGIVKIVNDANGQHMVASKMGSSYVYLYTNGGVPFMRLDVLVMGAAPGMKKDGYIDIQPADWRLDGDGSSTELVFKADKQYNDLVVDVVAGQGYIKDGKLYADCANGVLLVKAYSAGTQGVIGYAIVYVGKYINSLYDGYWSAVNNGIICNYWNPNLWGCDGYKIKGWIVTNWGAYIPVIFKTEVTVTKPNSTTTTVTVYSDLYDLLYNKCYGNVDTLYKWLWWNYNTTKPSKTFAEMYQEALDKILADIADSYYKQLH